MENRITATAGSAICVYISVYRISCRSDSLCIVCGSVAPTFAFYISHVGTCDINNNHKTIIPH